MLWGKMWRKLCQLDFLPNKRRVTFWISLSSMFDLKRLKPCVHGIVTWSQMPVFKTVLWFLFFSSIKRIGYYCISFDIKKLQQRKQKSLILHHSASCVLISCPNSIKTWLLKNWRLLGTLLTSSGSASQTTMNRLTFELLSHSGEGVFW